MKTIFFIVFLVIAKLSFASEKPIPTTSSRENSEVKMAESAILASVMVPANDEGQLYLNNIAFSGDLGLALIAARNSKISLNSLANLLRYRLDGSLAEDYHCYVPEKGKHLIIYLKQINPDKLEKQCIGEVLKLVEANPSLFSDKSETKCTSKAEIKKQVKELIASINTRCNPEDF